VAQIELNAFVTDRSIRKVCAEVTRNSDSNPGAVLIGNEDVVGYVLAGPGRRDNIRTTACRGRLVHLVHDGIGIAVYDVVVPSRSSAQGSAAVTRIFRLVQTDAMAPLSML